MNSGQPRIRNSFFFLSRKKNGTALCQRNRTFIYHSAVVGVVVAAATAVIRLWAAVFTNIWSDLHFSKYFRFRRLIAGLFYKLYGRFGLCDFWNIIRIMSIVVWINWKWFFEQLQTKPQQWRRKNPSTSPKHGQLFQFEEYEMVACENDAYVWQIHSENLNAFFFALQCYTTWLRLNVISNVSGTSCKKLAAN